MTTEFVKVNLKNNPATTAVLENYRDIICEYGEKGFFYQGYIPVKMGPSGKLLEIDLVFQK